MTFRFLGNSAWALVAGLGLACVTSSGSGSGSGSTAAASTNFEAKGGVSSGMGSASFDDTSVRGPRLSVSRRSDGSWAGNILDQVIDVNVYPDRLSGANLKASITQSPDGYVVDGLLGESIIHFEVRPKQLVVSAGSKSFKISGPGDGTYGIDGQVRFTGQAVGVKAPQPQMMFALMGAFVASTHGGR